MFIPLHLTSSYSFLSSGFTMDRLISSLKEKQYSIAGLADYQVLFGVPEFATLTKKNQIQSIIGLDIAYSKMLVTFFAKNEDGYRLLIKLSQAAHLNQIETFQFPSGCDDVIAVISSDQSPIFSSSFSDIALYLQTSLKGLKKVYVGIESYPDSNQENLQSLRQFAKQYTYPTVAFPHILYGKPSDAIVVDMLKAIQKSETLQIKEKNGRHYLPFASEVESLYTSQEIIETVNISNACKFNFFIKRGQLLSFEPGKDSQTLLREKAIEGLQNRPIDFTQVVYLERLDQELTMIENLGFADYFLIVADFIQYAKQQNIPVGPGRGSAPGSLVAYALGITDIDPIPHQLLFERFLNPSRKTMPDIDTDFADKDREKIVQYLTKKYGADRVSHIVTYQTIQAKQAIRDVGKIYKFSTTSIELLSKALGDGKLDLRSAYKKLPAFQKLFDEDSECAEIVKLAHKIEGFIRQPGIHAAGIILNQSPLIESLPLLQQSDKTVTQYEMNHLEAQGYLKIDILGLKNLSIIESCLAILHRQGIQVKLNEINLEDPQVYSLLRTGLNMGIFQLESDGMKRAMKTIQVDRFNDLVSLIALYRPGPMDNIESYARRKQGLEPITYLDQQLKPILNPTFGIIIYQEQIMQIAQTMAGFTLAKADDFRRAISKKDNEVMLSLKQAFIDGAVAKGYKADHALSVYNHILKFADYGFNKSHSVAYATLTYQMAYLKTYYPHAFYAAILNASAGTSDTKLLNYLDELRTLKISLTPPNIQSPSTQFMMVDQRLIAPLTLIKGIHPTLVEGIIKVRSKGPFLDLFDCVTRLFPLNITLNQHLALIDAGAYDGFGINRATLRTSLPNAMKNAAIQSTFMDEATGLLPTSSLPKMAYIESQDSAFDNLEKELDVTGMILSQSVMGPYRLDKQNQALITIQEAKKSNQVVMTGGLIRTIRVVKTKAGQTMAFITMYDETDKLDLVIFPKLYEKVGLQLARGQMIIVVGTVDKEKQDSLIVDQIRNVKS
ncbi:MAG: DNA polymerase III subunit alpha [Bacilli bacterium]